MQTVIDSKPGTMRWRPTPFVVACLVLHAVVPVALVLFFASWKLILLLVVILHGVIAVTGLLPRSTLLGRNLTRLGTEAAQRGEIAITIDDGPDPIVTPQVLAILAAKGACATFFCIGQRAAAHPNVCRAIVAAGHDIEDHGQFHRNHSSFFGLSGWRNEIIEARATISAITGQEPHFFRPVAGLRNPFLDVVLQQLGMRLASWTRRGYDTRTNDADVVYARLIKNLAAGDILLLHDGNAARTKHDQPVILEVLPRLLDELAAQKLTPVTLRQGTRCEPVRPACKENLKNNC